MHIYIYTFVYMYRYICVYIYIYIYIFVHPCHCICRCNKWINKYQFNDPHVMKSYSQDLSHLEISKYLSCQQFSPKCIYHDTG